MKKYIELGPLKKSLWEYRNYIELEKKSHPQITLTQEKDFIFEDCVEVENLTIVIQFLSDRLGRPTGYITNNYFPYPDSPDFIYENGYYAYKQDLLERIKSDIENKRTKSR